MQNEYRMVYVFCFFCFFSSVVILRKAGWFPVAVSDRISLLMSQSTISVIHKEQPIIALITTEPALGLSALLPV